MDLSVIPWRIFFEALKDQQRSVVEMWVGRWRFTNEGVLRADPSSLGATELLFEKVS
jgi:hypothetical protein